MATYLTNSVSSIFSTIRSGSKQKEHTEGNKAKNAGPKNRENFFSKFDSAIGNSVTKSWTNHDYISLHEKEMDSKKKSRKSQRGFVGAFLHTLYHKETPEMMSQDRDENTEKQNYDTNFQYDNVYNEEKMEETNRLIED